MKYLIIVLLMPVYPFSPGLTMPGSDSRLALKQMDNMSYRVQANTCSMTTRISCSKAVEHLHLQRPGKFAWHLYRAIRAAHHRRWQ